MTEANEKRLYCGQSDIPLSDKGKSELAGLKKTVAYPAADVYISSGLLRADETLRILYDKAPDAVIGELGEMDFGDFEMKSYDELKDDPGYRRWIGDIDFEACPGGESKVIFDDRVMNGFERLCAMDVRSAVAIFHGGPIALIMERLFPARKYFYEWQPDFGRGYTLDITSGAAALISEI